MQIAMFAPFVFFLLKTDKTGKKSDRSDNASYEKKLKTLLRYKEIENFRKATEYFKQFSRTYGNHQPIANPFYSSFIDEEFLNEVEQKLSQLKKLHSK